MKQILFLLLVIFSSANMMADDEVRIDTYTYAVKDGDSLKLDVYTCPSMQKETKQLAYIFSFGGAWETGQRTDAKFLRRFAQEGYIGISIDYRRVIARLKAEGVDVMKSFGKSYNEAIRTGVEDLYDATRWVVEHAEMLHVDTSKVVISGSSAGATNALVAEYLLCNKDPLISHLPQGFRYAGVVPFAGGIWKAGTEPLTWPEKPCPFCIIHGDKDQLVPYGSSISEEQNFSGIGPEAYTQQLDEMKVPYFFLTGHGADHLLSGAPLLFEGLVDYTDYVFSFLNRLVLKQEKVSQRISENYLDRDYSLESVIKMFQDFQQGK